MGYLSVKILSFVYWHRHSLHAQVTIAGRAAAESPRRFFSIMFDLSNIEVFLSECQIYQTGRGHHWLVEYFISPIFLGSKSFWTWCRQILSISTPWLRGCLAADLSCRLDAFREIDIDLLLLCKGISVKSSRIWGAGYEVRCILLAQCFRISIHPRRTFITHWFNDGRVGGFNATLERRQERRCFDRLVNVPPGRP